jgi:hypothetical protein
MSFALLRAAPRADVVTEWNELLLVALRAENTAPTGASRTVAIVQAAVYDAVNSILRTHEPYRFQVPAAPDALPEAAALAAAYQTMIVLCPTMRGVFDAAYARGLAALPEGPGREDGLRVGREVAILMLEWRNADGATTQVPYIPSTAPGAWRRTPPDFRPPLDPHWRYVKPFAIPSTAYFPVPPPPALDSAEYAAAFEEVRQVGARVSATRTSDQTEIGKFWAYDRSGMGPVLILYNNVLRQIAERQGNSLSDNARLFALVNLAHGDACIVCWEAKYRYNFWRPVTAIPVAATDGNPATAADPAWEPLGVPGSVHQPNFTPNFPSYPSGHAIHGSALFRMLQRFYGRDDIAFSATSEEVPGAVRHYTRLSQADEENALARVYLGVHWVFDQRAAQVSGWALADYIFENWLRPVAAVPHLGRPLPLPDGSRAVRLSSPPGIRWLLKVSEDLRSWHEVFTETGSFTFLDTAPSPSARFYRAVRIE